MNLLAKNRLTIAIEAAVLAIAVAPSPTTAQCGGGGGYYAGRGYHRGGYAATVYAPRVYYSPPAAVVYRPPIHYDRPAYAYRSYAGGARLGHNHVYGRSDYGHRYGYRSYGSHGYGRLHGGGSHYGGHH